MTVRELIQALIKSDHVLDEEIKLCMFSYKDEDTMVDFRINSVDENSINFRPRGVSLDHKMFGIKLPKCEIEKKNREYIFKTK